MKHCALLAAGLFLTATGAIAADLVALRVTAPATLLRAGSSATLAANQAVTAGDVVSAGARGKVALQLGGSGLMTLSSLGDVQVFDARVGNAKQPAIAKLKLLAGAMRIDSRAIKGKPTQDVRLNVGSLKTRLLNADAWAANTAEGDTVCLMTGSINVQTSGQADERLDQPGSCLRREPDGQVSRFAASNDAVIVGAIAATRFEDMDSFVSTRMAEASAEDAVVISVAPPTPPTLAKPSAPVIAVARPAAQAAPAAPVMAATGSWTVVVMSMAKPEPVTAQTQALVQKGLPATAVTATVKGTTMHRVTVGRFATQAEARAYATGTLAKSGIKGWATPL